MKNKLSKILISFILTLSFIFSLSGCVVIEGIVGSGETLLAPTVKINEDNKIVYWDSVDGAGSYTVTINNTETKTVKTTFYSFSSFSGGTYTFSVKALPSSAVDNESSTSNVVTVVVDNTSGDSINYVELINGVTEEVMQANVTVIQTNKKIATNANGGAQGSGIIYKVTKSMFGGIYTYFVLTNNHVVYQNTSENYDFSYTVTDMYNNEHQATLVANNANYDLAVLQFTVVNDGVSPIYTPISLASNDVTVGDNVISIGQPGGQKNAVTLGSVIGISKLDINVDPNANMSNVTFNVLKHNAPIKGGSSGGAVLDYNYKLVGLNYATGSDNSGNYTSSYAIPISKIKEFLKG